MRTYKHARARRHTHAYTAQQVICAPQGTRVIHGKGEVLVDQGAERYLIISRIACIIILWYNALGGTAEVPVDEGAGVGELRLEARSACDRLLAARVARMEQGGLL